MKPMVGMPRMLRLVGAACVAGLLLACFNGALQTPAAALTEPRGAVAIFAGGCFWCSEKDFETLDGVTEVESGYTGGRTANPTYEEVSSGITGHTEAVRVVYDPARISYAQLLDHFWRNVDPTVKDAQFCDHGSQYRSAIFWRTEDERKAAEASRDALLKSGRFAVIYTEIVPATTFWVAEAYHQNYYKTHAIRYNYYRFACGRDARLKELWGPK